MLSPYRVLDLTDERGQLCGQILGDLGAEVILLEPPGGSSSRTMAPFAGNAPDSERSLWFWSYNRGKRSIELDHLSAGPDREVFLRLVADHGDVAAVHSMKDATPGSWHRWTYAELAQQVARTAAGLAALGVELGERVLLMMRNRPDFHWLDLGAQFGIDAVPLLVVLGPDDTTRYFGGYTERKQGPEPRDLAIIANARAGYDDEGLPLFGCAASRGLREIMNPLGLP